MQHTRTFTPVSGNTRSRAASHPHAVGKQSPYARLAKKIFKRTKLHLCIYSALFFLIPALLSPAADDVILTLIYPIFCFFLSAAYGYKYGFIKHYLIIPTALFMIASLIHFEAFSFLYGLCYLMTGVIAMAFGTICRQLK